MPIRFLLAAVVLAALSTPLRAQPDAEPSLLADSARTAAVATAARALEAEIGAGRAEAFGEWFDGDAFIDRANEGRQIGALVMGDMRRLLRDDPKVLHAITEQLQAGGHYRFLRVVERDGDLRARFRMLAPTGGLNYHDLLLRPDTSGTGRFEDLYVYVSAEDLSDTIGRLMEVLAAEGGPSPRAEAYSTFTDHYNAGRFREAWDAFPAAHLDAKNRKAFMIMRIIVGMNVGDREYYQALDDFTATFPDDPSLSILLLDVLINAGDFEGLLENVDRLDESVGGDPYLNLYRAMAHAELGAPKAALDAIERALDAEPKLLLPNALAFQILVSLERFDDAAAALRRIGDLGIHLEPSYIEAEASNAAFIQSKAYQAWLSKHGS